MPRSALVIALAGLLYLQYRLWLGPGSYAEVRALSQRVMQAAQHNESLVERNARIEAEIWRLENDPDAIEYHARADLGMVRPGESFYLIVH